MIDRVPDPIIAEVYGAASGRVSWTSPLEALAAHFELWSLQLIGIDRRVTGYRYRYTGGHADAEPAMLDYVHEYHALNPRLPLHLRLRPGEWLHDTEQFDQRYIDRSPYFQEYLLPHGGGYLSATRLHICDDEWVTLAAARPAGRPPLNAEELDRLRPVVYHLGQALRIREHLREGVMRLGIATELLDKFTQPMLLMDPQRTILFANGPARRLLCAEDAWIVHEGRLLSRHSNATTLLTQRVAALEFSRTARRSNEPAAMVGAQARGGANVLAFLAALQPQDTLNAFGPSPIVLVTFYDPRERRRLDPLIVREAFGMTPAESRVCVDLVQGLSVEEIARQRQVTLATVRKQVQQALMKVRLRRQPELVGLLGRLPPVA